MGPKGFYFLLLLLLGLLVLHMKIEEIAGFPSGQLRIGSAEEIVSTPFSLTIDPEVQEFETTSGPFLQNWASASGRDSLVQKGNIKDNHGLNAKQVAEETSATASATEVEDQILTTTEPALLDLVEPAETAGEESSAELAAITATEVPGLNINSTEGLVTTAVPETDIAVTDAPEVSDSKSEALKRERDLTKAKSAEDADLNHTEDCEDDDLEHGPAVHEQPSDSQLHQANNEPDAQPSEPNVKQTVSTDTVDETTTVPVEPEVTPASATSEPPEDDLPTSTTQPEVEEATTSIPAVTDAEISPAEDLQITTAPETAATTLPEPADEVALPTTAAVLEAQDHETSESAVVQTTSAPSLDFDTEDTEVRDSTDALLNSTASPLEPVDLAPPTVQAIETEPPAIAEIVSTSRNEAPPTQISIVTSEHVVKVERRASTNNIIRHGSSYAIVPISNMNTALTATKHRYNESDIIPGPVIIEDFSSESNQIFDAVLTKSPDEPGPYYWFLSMKNSQNEFTVGSDLRTNVIQVISARNAIHPEAVLIKSHRLDMCLEHQGESEPCIYKPCEITEMKQQFELKFLYESKKVRTN